MEIGLTWAQMKNVLSSKSLEIQYVTLATTYLIWAEEGSTIYRTQIVIETPAGTDQTDFETNYQPTANKPVFIGEDKIVDAVAVRDTSDRFSAVSDNRGAVPKTVIVHNELNQSVAVQLQGDREATFSNVINIGSPFTINATSDDYVTMSDYFPYLRVKYTCSVAPTTGAVTIYMEKVRA